MSDEILEAAAKMLAALKAVPESERMEVLAIVCKVFIETGGGRWL